MLPLPVLQAGRLALPRSQGLRGASDSPGLRRHTSALWCGGRALGQGVRGSTSHSCLICAR